MEEPANVDERRAGVGLESLADYKARFADLCREEETPLSDLDSDTPAH